jgi:hypothetical protein
MQEETVKWRTTKKYPCKKNKGEHEWGVPKLSDKELTVRYVYKREDGRITDTHEHEKEGKLIEAYVFTIAEVRCIHCNKKVILYFKDKLK